ncbi:hypothetical protein J6590_035410 [Homalodisca vitripennis]|nr:hypothetical protein J6590_035410 [Homalodisca vitripennis]
MTTRRASPPCQIGHNRLIADVVGLPLDSRDLPAPRDPIPLLDTAVVMLATPDQTPASVTATPVLCFVFYPLISSSRRDRCKAGQGCTTPVAHKTANYRNKCEGWWTPDQVRGSTVTGHRFAATATARSPDRFRPPASRPVRSWTRLPFLPRGNMLRRAGLRNGAVTAIFRGMTPVSPLTSPRNSSILQSGISTRTPVDTVLRKAERRVVMGGLLKQQQRREGRVRQ